VTPGNRDETLACQRMMTYIQTPHDVRDPGYARGFLSAQRWMLQGHRHRIWTEGRVNFTEIVRDSWR
jgi:hypothetical protein